MMTVGQKSISFSDLDWEVLGYLSLFVNGIAYASDPVEEVITI